MRILIATATILSISGAAMAADLAVAPIAPAPIYTPPASVWTGWYFGLDAGYGWAGYSGIFDSSESQKKFETFLSEANPQGGVVGGHVGYDFQNGSMVWGFEADAMYAGITGTATDNKNEDPAETTLNFLGSLRGRLGVAAQSNLFYGTAGVAIANSEVTLTDLKGAKGQNSGSMNFTSGGLVVGAGIEHAFNRNVSARLEGLYYFFDGTKHSTSNLTKDSDKNDYAALDSAGLVRLGLNFRY